MNEAVNPGPRNGILSLTIKDKSVLYAAYMPFIKNGGLFIPTNKSYKLGDEVFMLLNLMDEAGEDSGGRQGHLDHPQRRSGQPRCRCRRAIQRWRQHRAQSHRNPSGRSPEIRPSHSYDVSCSLFYARRFPLSP